MVRRSPQVDDRIDLDKLAPEGEPPWRLLATIAGVAIDGGGDGVVHGPTDKSRAVTMASASTSLGKALWSGPGASRTDSLNTATVNHPALSF